MGYILDGEVMEQLRQGDILAGKRYLCGGSCSDIYDNGDTVFRVSTDGTSQEFIEAAFKAGMAVPTMAHNYGCVIKEDEDDVFSDEYWLCEIEKLTALSSHNEKMLDGFLCTLEDACGFELALSGGDQMAIIRKFIKDIPRPPLELNHIIDTIIYMTTLAEKYWADLDLNVSNFMQRSLTGEILAIDPAHGGYV